MGRQSPLGRQQANSYKIVNPKIEWGGMAQRHPFTTLSAPSSRQQQRFHFLLQRLFPRGSSLPVSDSFCLLMFSSPPRVNFQNIPECSFTLHFFFSMFFFGGGRGWEQF